MKHLVLAAGALICVTLLTTCGTVRAISGDYEADYDIITVTPTEGVSGAQAQFEAVVFSAPGASTNPTYIWDFGGGAVPNVSYDKAPLVTLRDGLRSPYQCRLTVLSGTGSANSKDQFDFTLTVAPLTVLTVTPTEGVGSGTATFSALIGSGNVTGYMWDFGGAGSPGGSNVANPTITFTDVTAVTEFQARVVVSNDFEAIEFPFTITVSPGT